MGCEAEPRMSQQNAKGLRNTLTDKRLVGELHALLWRRPFTNGTQRDEGLMCREHALFTASIGAVLGFRAALCWGSIALIGPVENGSAGALYLGEHSWCMFERAGIYDLSLKLDLGDGPGWGAWPARLLAGDGFNPGKRVEFRLFHADQAADFRAAITSATYKARDEPGRCYALYHGKNWEHLAADYLNNACEYVNSPLTDDLKKMPSFTPEIYAKAIRHCWNVLNRRTRSLWQLPQGDAWELISASDPGALDWLLAKAVLTTR